MKRLTIRRATHVCRLSFALLIASNPVLSTVIMVASLLHTETDGAAISRKGIDAGKAQKQATDTFVLESELEVQTVPHFTEPEPESVADQVQNRASHLSWVTAVATRSAITPED